MLETLMTFSNTESLLLYKQADVACCVSSYKYAEIGQYIMIFKKAQAI